MSNRGINPFTGQPLANFPSSTVSRPQVWEPVVHEPNKKTGTWHSNDGSGSGWVDTGRAFNKPLGGGSRRRTVHRKRKSHRKSKRVHHTRRKQSRRHRHSRRRHHR
jgi:hypothetical protein